MSQWGISAIVFMVLNTLASIISDIIISAMQSGLFDYVSNWITIPIVNQVILWGEAIAIVLVIAIRIGVGISQGILTDEVKAPEYLFKSVGSVVLIGLMPVFCNLVIVGGQTMMQDVLGICGTSQRFVDKIEIDYLGVFTKDLFNLVTQPSGEVITVLVNNLVGAVVLIMMLIVFFELMKRQIEMLVISVAAPFVGIKVATENSSGDYWGYLTNLFGMCVVQWIQTLFLSIGMQVYTIWMKAAQGNNLFTGLIVPSGVNSSTWYVMAIMIAILLAAINVPSLLDHWTFSGSGSTSITNLFVRSAMTKAMPVK